MAFEIEFKLVCDEFGGMTGARRAAGAFPRVAPHLPFISGGQGWPRAGGTRGRSSLLAAPAWKCRIDVFPGATGILVLGK